VTSRSRGGTVALGLLVLGLAIGVNLGVASLFGTQGVPGLGAAAVIGVVTGLSASGLYSWSTSGGQPRGEFSPAGGAREGVRYPAATKMADPV